MIPAMTTRDPVDIDYHEYERRCKTNQELDHDIAAVKADLDRLIRISAYERKASDGMLSSLFRAKTPDEIDQAVERKKRLDAAIAHLDRQFGFNPLEHEGTK